MTNRISKSQSVSYSNFFEGDTNSDENEEYSSSGSEYLVSSSSEEDDDELQSTSVSKTSKLKPISSKLCPSTSSFCSNDNSSSMQKKHIWVYDLKDMDNENELNFDQLFLIICRIRHKHIQNTTFHTLKDAKAEACRNVFKSVIAIPRNTSGQMYVAQGLQSSLHFSLGPNGKDELHKFCNRNSIEFVVLDGFEAINYVSSSIVPKKSSQCQELSLFVKNVNPKDITELEKKYIARMKAVANELWSTLFPVSIFYLFNFYLYIYY